MNERIKPKPWHALQGSSQDWRVLLYCSASSSTVIGGLRIGDVMKGFHGSRMGELVMHDRKIGEL